MIRIEIGERVEVFGKTGPKEVFTGHYLDKNREPEHDWEVYSTSPGAILVQCKRCGQRGFVEIFTDKEWDEAFHAPSNPYTWRESSRVVIDAPVAAPFSDKTKRNALRRSGEC